MTYLAFTTSRPFFTSIFFLAGIPHIALFDFDPQDFRELALHQSDLVTVTIMDEGGWVKATNAAGKEGWVPQNFVAPFDPKQYAETKNAVDVSSKYFSVFGLFIVQDLISCVFLVHYVSGWDNRVYRY